jgi:site-specific DNA-methyltransferase (adenine-specific)
MRSVWVSGTPNAVEKKYGKHPTQKPVLLMKRIIEASTNPGDLILDPFCGSATTGVAALELNRRFIGIDMSKEYLDNLAINRLNDVEKTLKLF